MTGFWIHTHCGESFHQFKLDEEGRTIAIHGDDSVCDAIEHSVGAEVVRAAE